MRGKGQAAGAANPTITAAFRSTLGHQFLIVLILVVVLILAWNVIRTMRHRRAVASGSFEVVAEPPWSCPEPVARQFLRITFGVLWVFDGLLQVKGTMPEDLPSGVLTPAATSSPGWVQHLVNVGATIWSDHPVSAAAATIWIQVGIGMFLLVAPRGRWSRSAGAASAAWGLVVWVFGEAFGGIFAPGSSWLLGTPGAALCYVVAGVLVALPDSRWESDKLGKGLMKGIGLFFIGMGILQAWPGRGFWSGRAGPTGAPGTLTAVVHQMARVPQPSVLSSGVRSFGSFEAAHGWVVNLIVVVLLLGIGVAFVSGRRRLLRLGVIVGAGLCLADWVLVQDFGFLGSVGTDPNSMIPMAALFITAYLAVVRQPAVATRQAAAGAQGEAEAPAPVEAPVAAANGRLGRLSPSYLWRSLAAIGAVGVVLLGAAPMALAATSPNADAIVTEAADGTPNIVDLPAAPFTLTDQTGRQVSLKSLAGHVVVLTFLDPVCTTDCPLIAQELRITDQMLGGDAGDVDLVAVVNNPLYHTTAFTAAFDKQEGLDQLANWTFLTGSLPALEKVWIDYGEQSEVTPAGAMVAHSDIVYIIDGKGRDREILDSDPGQGSPTTKSSFSALLAGQVRHIVQS
ncbi:MAG: SCO family protein [Acidimicrobiales bacterium]|jgi:cytochrome oxidase Cu insertion factor (SCO1/SenC/PrrC family)